LFSEKEEEDEVNPRQRRIRTSRPALRTPGRIRGVSIIEIKPFTAKRTSSTVLDYQLGPPYFLFVYVPFVLD
jgi:hypothetical protein